MTVVRTFKYESLSQFESDTDKHLVDPTSNYGYSDGKAMYGWVMSEARAVTPRMSKASTWPSVACDLYSKSWGPEEAVQSKTIANPPQRTMAMAPNL